MFGSKGLVGSALLKSKPSSHELIGVSREHLNIADTTSVVRLLSDVKPDAIVLAAAKVGGIGANSKNQSIFLIENLRIQDSVISSAATLGVQNLIFLGSSCVYPRFANQPISENELLNGPLEQTNEAYAIAKIAGIRLCKAITEEYQMNYFSLMPTNLYGPNDNFDKFTSHVPAALMRKFHEAKINEEPEVVVWGTGSARREFMHVDDLVSSCWYMLGQKIYGELINIGTGEDLTIAEFAKLMATVVGYDGNIVYDNSMPDGTPRKLLDVTKAQSYGWKHQIQLEEGLRQTYAWFVDALSKEEVRGY